MKYLRIRLIGLPVLLFVAAAVSGCGLLVAPPQAAIFELRLLATVATREERQVVADAADTQRAAGHQALRPLRLVVIAPSWLQSRAMHYRLDYRDGDHRRAYRASRWVAAPTEMIAVALERHFIAVAVVDPGVQDHVGRKVTAAPYYLRLHLDEFIQVFVTEQHSYSLLQVQAELRCSEKRGGTIARRQFAISREAPSLDAAGGVAAHRLALQVLAEELQAWLVAHSTLCCGGPK